MRITKARQRKMVPSVDTLESRELLSGNGLQSATVQGSIFGPLTSTSAVSAADVWAVGRTTTPFGLVAPVVEHFDGTSWSVVNTAPLSGDTNATNGVVALAINDVWVVGQRLHQTSSGIVYTPLIEHFDGKRWSVVSSPSIPSGTLNAVSATSATDIRAVGNVGRSFGHNLIEHSDGKSWSVVPSPTVSHSPTRDRLTAVSADAPNDAWAVGTAGAGDYQADEVLHWDGTAWSVATPAAGMHITSIAAVSATNVWAVGTRLDLATHSFVTSIEHFDGTSWTIVTAPAPANSALNGISAASATNIWAVGQVGNATFAEHFDGTTWNFVSIANPTSPSGGSNDLLAVTALPDGTVVAVGGQDHGVTDTHPLILD
jgi:hypothetical protein